MNKESSLETCSVLQQQAGADELLYLFSLTALNPTLSWTLLIVS